MKKLLVTLVQFAFTMALTSILTKKLITSGLADDVLRTEIGLSVYGWIWNTLGIVGGEDGELLLIVIVFCSMLVLSSGVCWFLSRCLAK
jgi:hypothetical protein